MAKFMKIKTRRGKLFMALTSVAGLIALDLGYSAASIYAYSRRTTAASAQAAIVLGASVWGQEPCPVFKERINHAIVLYRAGKAQKLLFTGGLGKGSEIAESESAKRYAIRQGVPAADIFTESESHTTLENLRFAQQVARQHQLTSFLLVSDPLHMKRAMTMANDMGLRVESSPTPTTRYKTFRSQWGMLTQETYFYIDYRLRRVL